MFQIDILSEPVFSNSNVFELNADEVKDLVAFHGFDFAFIAALEGSKFDGSFLKELARKSDVEEVKNLIMANFKMSAEINQKNFKQLFSLVQNYKSNHNFSTYKVFNDCVHGHMNLHPLIVKIINMPEFQRLRYNKQTGILLYVFPSSTHSRFEHCIGTSYLASLFVQHFIQTQPKLNISLQDYLCVQIAALLHDVGHGPYSHLFEKVIQKLNINNWKHEIASLLIVERIYEKLKLEFESFGLFEDDLSFIKDLIYVPGFKDQVDYRQQMLELESLKKRGIEKSFLYEILSNRRNGIDVDKWEYFERDCFQLGIQNTFNHKRYIKYSRVIMCEDGLNQICLRDKEVINVYEMFHMREQLNRRAYQHEVAIGIEIMVIEAFIKADKFFKFTEILTNFNLDEYLKLNDSIHLQILFSNDLLLKESKEILERIENRMLYKYITSAIIRPMSDETNFKNELKKYMLAKFSEADNYSSENILFEITRFNYGARERNPIDNLRFFNKYDLNKAFKIEKSQVSGMLLNVFEDIVLRVYYKQDSYDLIKQICKYFGDWCQENNFSKTLYGVSFE